MVAVAVVVDTFLVVQVVQVAAVLVGMGACLERTVETAQPIQAAEEEEAQLAAPAVPGS